MNELPEWVSYITFDQDGAYMWENEPKYVDGRYVELYGDCDKVGQIDLMVKVRGDT